MNQYEQAVRVLKTVFKNVASDILRYKINELFDDQFNYYRRAWKKVYGLPEEWLFVTSYGYQDPFGITKYYSQTISPFQMFTAGEPLRENDPVYIHQDGKAYKYTGEHS